MGSFMMKITFVMLLSVVCVVKGSDQKCYDEFSNDQYLGCFVDNSERILPNLSVRITSAAVCIQFCGRRNYKLAGSENNNECYCADEMVSQIKAPEEECNMKCVSGNEKCGGPWRISVYKTEKIQFDEYKEQYQGCYVDASDRILPDAFWGFGQNCPNKCLIYCKNKGYKYAGVEYSKECFCGNKLHGNVQKVDEEDCNMACSGCNAKCGGGWRINIYSTDNIPSVEGQYEGCFVDAHDRVLKGKMQHLNDNCADVCIGFCRSHGFKYAGVEWRHECFCGNEYHGEMVSDDECNTPCKGCGSKNCGGGWRIGIYRTDYNPFPEELTANYTDGCNVCQCSWVRGAFVSECTKKACPSLNCQEQEQLPGKCCPSCKKGCFKNGVEYKDGPFGDACEGCVCKNGEISCQPPSCPKLKCVDPVKEDGSCCYTCPKGVSCQLKNKILYASTPLSDKKKEYMCDPKDWNPNPWMRNKKIPGKTLKQLKKFKNIIDLP